MPTKQCKIAHITDLHLREVIPGTSASPQRQSRLTPLALQDLLGDLQKQSVDLLVITGDLVDVELPHTPENDEMVLAEYKLVKERLDASGLRYHVIPGNHDVPELLFQVFGKESSFEVNDYEFISFYDHQIGGDPVYRQDAQLEYFKSVCRSPGPRQQIHLQHYLLYPNHNEGWPHTYANAGVLLQEIAESERVLLCLSGHYHPGCQVERLGETQFFTGEAFTERNFPYAIVNLVDEQVEVQQTSMKAWCDDSPIISTYRGGGTWHHGNLHMHCSENSPCSVIPLQSGVEMFASAKHDFLAVTDHDVIADLSDIKKKYPDMVFYEGFEHSVSNHMLFINETVEPLFEIADKKQALQNSTDYLSIVCHPQGPKLDYWTVDELLSYPVKPTGVEVFNGHYGVGAWRKNGCGWDYTEFWSACLDAGMQLFAYANDDFHDGEIDFNNGWNVVLSEETDAHALLDALKSGACYATTGLQIRSIQEYRGRIVVNVGQEVHGRFVGPENKTLSSSTAEVFEFQAGAEAFVRFEAEAGGHKCWTQPMFAVAEQGLQLN